MNVLALVPSHLIEASASAAVVWIAIVEFKTPIVFDTSVKAICSALVDMAYIFPMLSDLKKGLVTGCALRSLRVISHLKR